MIYTENKNTLKVPLKEQENLKELFRLLEQNGMDQDLGGRGWYQEWGKPAQELHAGDVVNIPPEVKHWHGAAKDSWFQHLAVEVPAEEASNEWLEAVSNEEYGKLK